MMDVKNQSSSKTEGEGWCIDLDDRRNVKERMLIRVAKSNAHFKHQQLGESDLTISEKLQIAEDVLSTKGDKSFLARFWQQLTMEDVEYFSKSRDDYEVNFYLEEIEKNCNAHFCTNVVKNRRYEAMKKLENEGEYFSEEEMKYRDPYLYEQLIGQFITEEEAQKTIDKSDLRFSTILLKHMDQLDENELYYKEKEKEECQMEEEDTSDDEEEIEEESTEEISEERKNDLKLEFTRIMKERFLAGKDKKFDYSSVDHNTEYDDLEVLERDEEEKYFDSEDVDDLDSSELMEEQIPEQTQAMCLDDSPSEHSQG